MHRISIASVVGFDPEENREVKAIVVAFAGQGVEISLAASDGDEVSIQLSLEQARQFSAAVTTAIDRASRRDQAPSPLDEETAPGA